MMRLFITADLHWGIEPHFRWGPGVGEADCQSMAKSVSEEGTSDDVLIVAGDVAEERRWAECFALFDDFSGMKIACAGNHDIWDRGFFDERFSTRDSGPSLYIYEELWPEACRKAGWHCLDREPVVIGDVGFVGNMAWYDYSFRDESLNWPLSAYERKVVPGEFSAVTNDTNYVKVGLSDVEFTAQLASRIQAQIEDVSAKCDRIVAVTHHPCFKRMLTGRDEMWTAISGSKCIGDLLLDCPKVVLYIAGHTHEFGVPETQVGHIRCVNPRSTYDVKRLVRVKL